MKPVSLRLLFACILLTSAAGTLAGLDRGTTTESSAPLYVPLDSWVYPAFKRLAALGYLPDAEGLVAPWTRSECLILVNEAEDLASRRSNKVDVKINTEARNLLSALKREFDVDIKHATQVGVESVYTRTTEIAGTPLRDSYHFGQTLVDDYGRPYGDGINSVNGFSAFATISRFSAYFRGEYQTAAANQPYNDQTRTLLETLDGVPGASFPTRSPVHRFDPLEMYVGTHLSNFNVTFGKQSSWWGPGTGSAFAFSNNAESIYSLKVAQQAPIVLPGPFRFLGHIRTDFMIGKLAGNRSPPRPLINAQKITFQLTKDFEVGFTRSAIFGGVGHPLTTSSILKSFFSTSSTGGTAFGSSSDPGDRRSGFDFMWHLPGIKHFVTIYSDSLADDEPNPLASPRRSAWAPGIYFPRLFNSRLDLRGETYSTWLYAQDAGGRFIYWNDQYRDAYTDDNNLIGSWIGRDARAYLASSTYWMSAQNTVTASFRQTKVGGNFLLGGGTQTDISLSVQWALRPGLMASLFTQYERIFIPVLGDPHRDLTAGLQLTLQPDRWTWRW